MPKVVNYQENLDAAKYWTTVRAHMSAIEAAVAYAGRRYRLIGSRHYHETADLVDHVLCELARLDAVGRFDPSRQTVRPGSARSAMAVYLYNQALSVVRHRAQDLARENTYVVADDETATEVRISYSTVASEVNVKDSDGCSSTKYYGDLSSDWSNECSGWGCASQESTDARSSLESILDLLDAEERTVLSAVVDCGSRSEAARVLNLRGSTHGDTDAPHTPDTVKSTLAAIARVYTAKNSPAAKATSYAGIRACRPATARA